MQSLSRCFNPQSVAVVGGKEAGRVIEQCRKFGFGGDLYAVNPRRDQLAGLDCYPDVSALPVAPDAVFVAVPAMPSIAMIRALSNAGAGGVICYASGFGETGNVDLNEALLEAAGSMPVIGPNCYGFLNAASGAALWPDQHGLRRLPGSVSDGQGIAIFSSSGNVSVNMTMQQRSLPIKLLVTVGNQVMVGMEDCLEAVIDDPTIGAIGIHIEGLRSLARFAELAARALDNGKTLVALKTGRTEMGARITLSHTATLAGAAAVYDALFDRLGIAVVDDIEVFLETLKLACVHGREIGPNIASMSCSGGEASLIADLVDERSLHFPALIPDHAERVQKTLNEFVVVANPLDYHTFIWGDADRLRKTFRAMMEGGFDLTLLILDYPCVNDCDMSEWIDAGNAFADACDATGQRGAVVSLMAENMPEAVREALIERGVAPLQGLRQAVAAIAALARAMRCRGTLPSINPTPVAATPTALSSRTEFDAKHLLAEYDIAVPRGGVALDADTAARIAGEIGYPVVVKASSETLQHKSDAGGVVLGVRDETALRAHVKNLLGMADGVLIEEMRESAVVELLVGIATDPQVGHYLVLGSGGVLTELLNDRIVLLLQVSEDSIRSALVTLRCSPLLAGFRGKPGADTEVIVAVVQRVIALVSDPGNQIAEMEINPLMVGVEGNGAVAADALIVEHQLPVHP